MNASTNYAPNNNPEVIEVESSQLYPLESFTKQIAVVQTGGDIDT